MSEAFSDDLSDPTPSPPPLAPVRPSTSSKTSGATNNANNSNNTRRGSTTAYKAAAHQRTTSTASAGSRVTGPHGQRGSMTAFAKSARETSAPASHSRTGSLANSFAMSQSAASAKGAVVNGHTGSGEEEEEEEDDEEDEEEEGGGEEDNENEAAQSGSDLSSSLSEGDDNPPLRATAGPVGNQAPHGERDEENDEENEEGGDEENEDDEKADDDDEEETPFAGRPPPRHGRTASGGAGPGRGTAPNRATRQASLRSGSAPGRTGRGVIPAGMWEWAKKKNTKKPKADKSEDEEEEGSEEEGEEADEEEETSGAPRHLANAREESLVQLGTAAPVDEDEPMLNDTTNPDSPNGAFNSDEDVKASHLAVPTVKIEPPPLATISTFRAQDLSQGAPSPSVSPAPTPAPVISERRTNGRSKGSTRTGSKRSHRPSAGKRISAAAAAAAAQQQQQQLQAQQEAEDEAEAEEVERANRAMELAEDGEDGEEDEGELEGEEGGEGEYGNRKDALDALSMLELKFALVRQRIYQDKMEELGREERLIKDGSHPELLHTYIELDKRKERRTTLADLKRKRDIDLAAVTRTNDEDAVWSWWLVQKDVVLSNLITEASRKRRRVERERRALLDPLRGSLASSKFSHLPKFRDMDGDRDVEEDVMPLRPSTKAILAVALRHPYARLRTYNPPQLGKNKFGENAVGAGKGKDTPTESMPTLSQLSQGEIKEDLEVLLGYRREVGAVLNAGAVPGMPEAGMPAGLGGVYGAPGMDPSAMGPISVSNTSVAAAAPEGFNPGGIGMGADPTQAGSLSDYPRNVYSNFDQREHGRSREGQAFNDHLAAHQHMGTGMPSSGGSKALSNGREKERERDRPSSKKYSTAPGVGTGHGGYVGPTSAQQQQQQQPRDRDIHSHSGYLSHSHRQPIDSYGSPGLGLQNMQRPPDTNGPRERENGMVGIQHMPLPPVPSTAPVGSSSGGSKHLHHHHPVPPASGHPQPNQHPSLMWDGSRRDREREGDLARERSHSGANRNPGMTSSAGYGANPGSSAGNGGSAGGMGSGSGRPHSHSMSHQHQSTHYHLTHTHGRSSAQGSTNHGHSHSTLHTHTHAHPHSSGSTSHVHVIHNHGPGPTGNGGNGGGGGVAGGASSSSSRRANAYEEPSSASGGGAHRSRTSYPSASTVDREKELRERERLAGAIPSMNVMHPSLSHGSTGQERDRDRDRDRHAGYAIPHSSRDSWSDRERDRAKERDERRDRDRMGHSQAGMSTAPGFSTLPQPSQPQQGGSSSNRGSRSGSISMHPSQGGGYPQSQSSLPGSRYNYGSSSAYSPPATQATQQRRNTPPPLLPPVPNTSRYTTSSNTHRRASPGPSDPLSYASSSQAQAEMAAIHSPTSSLNPPGFNPWSAPPRSSGRPYQPSPPPQKIPPPTIISGTTFNSSASGGPLNPLPGPTLSPILPSASTTSPAPLPSISPAPRPSSSASLHAILQPSSRDAVLSPQPPRRSGSSGDGGGSGAAPMEVDSVVQPQTSFGHPSLAPSNHEGK